MRIGSPPYQPHRPTKSIYALFRHLGLVTDTATAKPQAQLGSRAQGLGKAQSGGQLSDLLKFGAEVNNCIWRLCRMSVKVTTCLTLIP